MYYIILYSYPQTDSFVVSQLFSVTRSAICFWLTLHLSDILPQSYCHSLRKWKKFLRIAFSIYVTGHLECSVLKKSYCISMYMSAVLNQRFINEILYTDFAREFYRNFILVHVQFYDVSSCWLIQILLHWINAVFMESFGHISIWHSNDVSDNQYSLVVF